MADGEANDEMLIDRLMEFREQNRDCVTRLGPN